uniref:Uncharacterized protein n=1 Tax=Faxonius propinquus nudivirus TaxID=3139431 RepID=A0AAU8GCZ5_9VIRU
MVNKSDFLESVERIFDLQHSISKVIPSCEEQFWKNINLSKISLNYRNIDRLYKYNYNCIGFCYQQHTIYCRLIYNNKILFVLLHVNMDLWINCRLIGRNFIYITLNPTLFYYINIINKTSLHLSNDCFYFILLNHDEKLKKQFALDECVIETNFMSITTTLEPPSLLQLSLNAIEHDHLEYQKHKVSQKLYSKIKKHILLQQSIRECIYDNYIL